MNGIEKRFRKIINKDKKYIEPWMLTWDYQEKRMKDVEYPKEYPQDFNEYSGELDLQRWINWITKDDFPDTFKQIIIEELIDLSIEYDFEITRKLDLNTSYDKLYKIGKYNAQDLLFQTLYPKPDNKITKVLDFGAGYGRQINLWSQNSNNLTYVAIDSIINSYCLQNLYLNQKNRLQDYVRDSDDFTIERKGIYHLPTWRCDILSSNYFDLVICNQVLQEINQDLLLYMLKVFNRVLKLGGKLYIRDHGKDWLYSSHKVDIPEELSNDFRLVFNPDFVDRIDIHGIPRIWQKIK